MTLVLDGVTKIVGNDTHIHETSVSLEDGLNVLIGPTLAGKTTLMRLMAGLDRPTKGRVIANGVDVTQASVRTRNVAMVYQQFVNYPSFTVYSNIASPLRRAGFNRKEMDERVRQTAALLHIEHLLDRLPAELSGGQQQRTAIARALVKDADLLLFDEPLVNLDYKLREELRGEMRQIFTRRKAVVVYATTEPMEALALGGAGIVVDEGRILQSGSMLNVYHHPNAIRVGEVFSDPPMNRIAGVVAGQEATLGKDTRIALSGHLAALADGPYTFGVRANHLSISRRSNDDIELDAVSDLSEVSGSETFIHVNYADRPLVVQEEGVHIAPLGVDTRVYVNPRSIFAFDADGRLAAAPPRPNGPQSREAA
jgi:glycerol transport system ATP-binding protein